MAAEFRYMNFVAGQTVTVIPSGGPNGKAIVVSVGRVNLRLKPTANEMESYWIIHYRNWPGSELNDDHYSVPKFHCREI